MIYDVMQEETEETMPYTADQQFDSWATDVPNEMPVFRDYGNADLPGWLTDLRDGTAVASATTGLARQQRLAQMERDIADLADFIADCDRYSEFMNALESPCVSPHVPRLMSIHLQERRQQAVLKGRRLRSELAVLRRQG
jgi:hypothetical protein